MLGWGGLTWSWGGFGYLMLTAAVQAATPPVGRVVPVMEVHFKKAAVAVVSDLSFSDLIPVEINLNGVRDDRPGLVAIVDGKILLPSSDLRRLGIVVTTAAPTLSIDGQEFVRLDSVPGVTGRLSTDAATLLLLAQPEAFTPTRVLQPVPGSAQPVGPIVPLAYLGYDLSLVRERSALQVGGLFDAGLSGKWGVVGTTALLRPDGTRLVRLESGLQHDFPKRRLRLIIGDTVTRGAAFGGLARFGGVRFGTDFSLSPAEITAPLPLLSGSATVPSTVELLMASGQQSQPVGPGRFLIQAPAVISGAGEVVMTIADATGTVRQLRRSFYSSARLLRPGLTDFSLEGGALRRSFGSRSGSYGQEFAAVSWRRGMASTLSAGIRIEASRSTAMGGATLDAVIGRLGEVALAGAMSRTSSGTGSLWRVQVQRLGRRSSFQAGYLRTSPAFSRIGDEQGWPRRHSQRELSVSAGVTLPQGELSAGLVDARLRDGSHFRLATLGYSARVVGCTVQGSFRATRLEGRANTGVFLALSRPFGRHGNAALTLDGNQVTASGQWSAPDRQGVSGGLAIGTGSTNNRMDGYVIANYPAGEIESTVTRANGSLAVRGNVRGAFVFISDHLVPMARLQDGLALVDVASDAPVRILQEGRVVARRARRGRPVLLTGLQPYATNRIAVRTDDLPLSFDLADDEVMAVPGFRQAVAVRFGGEGTRSPVNVVLVDVAGQPIAAGLDVFLDGLRIGCTGSDGLVFLATGGGEQLRVGLGKEGCEVHLPYPLAEGSTLRCVRKP